MQQAEAACSVSRGVVSQPPPVCLRATQRAQWMAAALQAMVKEKKKKRQDDAFRRQFIEKPSIMLGCPEAMVKRLQHDEGSMLNG